MNHFPSFSYSSTMQIILFFVACGGAFLSFHFVTDLISIVYGETFSPKRKFLFTTIISLFLNQFWVYAVYILGNFKVFTPMIYGLVRIPNPVFALLYYWCGIKILKLSKYRSIHLMRMVYLYVIMMKVIGWIVDALFPQDSGPYNYFRDVLVLVCAALMYIVTYLLIKRMLRSTRFQIHIKDSLPVRSLTWDLFLSFLQATFVYVAVVMLPFFMPTPLLSSCCIVVILGLYLLQSTILHYNKIMQGELENKDFNIQILTNAIDDFSGLKHDFYNILQTYEGHLFTGDLDKLKKYHERLLSTTTFVSEQLDLTPQMYQNPLLTSLLIDKMQAATQAEIKLSVNVFCDVEQLYIPNDDLCRAVSLLLDSALEIALQSEHKHLTFSIEQKENASKLIIVNSSSAYASFGGKEELHAAPCPEPCPDLCQRYQFLNIHSIFDKYSNIFFHTTVNANDFEAYIELSPPL